MLYPVSLMTAFPFLYDSSDSQPLNVSDAQGFALSFFVCMFSRAVTLNLCGFVSGLTCLSNSYILKISIFTSFPSKFHISFTDVLLPQAFDAYEGQAGKVRLLGESH